MNIQEIDKWLDNEYGCSYTRLEELHDYFFEKYTDQKEEIEDLEKQIELLVKDDESSQQTIINQKQEIERLQNIIKEVRGIIEKESFTYEHITGDYRVIESDLILEILDKGKE